MSLGLIGKKLGMTQIFAEDGEMIPVTVIEAGPCVVVLKKTEEKDGYRALQVGFGDVKHHEKYGYRVNKPIKGHFAKAGVDPKRHLREFRMDEADVEGYKVGQELKVDIFTKGEKVDVSGVSKGKGFAGMMKRHNASGGPASHGASKFHRQPGSSGANTYPGRVVKGKTMPGHLGSEKVTVKNLEIVEIDIENNLLMVRGAVPGSRETLLVLSKRA